jgi:hypothetical protein
LQKFILGLKLERDLWGKKEEKVIQKSKNIPITGHGGLYSCQMSRILHFLDNWLTDGG